MAEKVKITEKMLMDAGRNVLGGNHLAVSVMAQVIDMKYSPIGESSWKHLPSNSRKSGNDVILKLSERPELRGNDLGALSDALNEVRAKWTDILEELKHQKTELTNEFSEWVEKFERLGSDDWSAVDDRCWGEVRHSWDEAGNKIIVVPSRRERGGQEYRIISMDPKDIEENSYSSEGLQATIKANFTDPMVKETKTHGYDDYAYPESLIDGQHLSAAAIASGLLTHTGVRDLDGQLCGIRLAAGPQGVAGRMTPPAYISYTTPALLRNRAREIPKISSVSNDPDEPTLCYLRKDYEKGACPTWISWMNNFENPKVQAPIFMAWIGSILDAENTGKQSVYIHSFGNNGNSKVCNALASVLGGAFTAIDGSKSMGNQFWAAKLEGRRLVAIADNKNPKIYMTGWVHNLTGGDSVEVERKGRDSHTSRLFGKLLVFGNIAPEINTDEDNQKSRIIYIPVRRLSNEEKAHMGNYVKREDGSFQMVGDSEFPKKLEAEVEAFLALCSIYYKKLAPNRSDILLPAEYEDDTCGRLQDAESLNLDTCFGENFEFSPEFSTDPKEMFNAYRSVAKDYGLPDTSEFYGCRVKAYLHNRGVDLKRPKVRDDGGEWVHGTRCWVGIRQKSGGQSAL